MVPTSLIYALAFHFGIVEGKEEDSVIPPSSSTEGQPLMIDATSSDVCQTSEIHESTPMMYWRCFKIVAWRSFNLMMVYFFEYVVSTGAADKANPAATTGPWVAVHAFAILSFCYQFGVLISRSSLLVVRIPWIEVVSILQGINFIFWLAEAKWHFLSVWAQFPLMVYVGLLGGASYVNVFYLILHDKTIRERDKELCVNITAFASTFGITFASLFVLLMDATFLAHTNGPVTNTTVCNVTYPHIW